MLMNIVLVSCKTWYQEYNWLELKLNHHDQKETLIHTKE